MGFAEAWLFALGAPAITLDTGRGTRAERFYAASGWAREADDGGRNARFRKAAALAAPAP